MKNILAVLIFASVFISCESPYMVKHPVSEGDTYYLYAVSTYSADTEDLTCAARGFPFGTYLEVQSISSGKKVTVKVTKRPEKNVVDLSKQAFSQIENDEKGRIEVRVTVTRKPEKIADEEVAANSFFTLQLGAFPDLETAKSFSAALKIESYIFVVKDSKELYRVRSGRFSSKEDAEKFKSENCSNMEALVVEVTE